MRIALMLRGHARTWRWTIPQLNRALAECSPNIDAYVCLWKSQSFGRRELRELCDLLPTVHQELIDQEQWDFADSCDGYTAPSWHGARLAQARRQHESRGVEYDMVIDTRPDIYVETHPSWFTLPEQGHLQSTLFTDPWFGSDRPGIEDHLLVMSPAVHDLWCERHHARYDIGYNHCILHQFCRDSDLTIGQVQWMRTEFVRPNWHGWADRGMSMVALRRALSEWNGMDKQERLQHCMTAGIDPQEFSAPFHLGEFA